MGKSYNNQDCSALGFMMGTSMLGNTHLMRLDSGSMFLLNLSAQMASAGA